ncbi:MAG TPA: hypothetical protein VEX39_17155 [Thermoleophilaceae bacterium]|nr:hypothetical protein [Thermoleophilaceae bacterium]
MPSLRKTFLATLAAGSVTALLVTASPAQSTETAGPAARGGDNGATLAGRGDRCNISMLARRIEMRRRMNQIKSSIVFGGKEVKKGKKAVKKAKKAVKKSATRKNKRKLKAAKKNLKLVSANLKESKASLPSAVAGFQRINELAVSRGCPNDDGKPKGRRG